MPLSSCLLVNNNACNLVIVFHSGLAQGVANPPSEEIGSDSFWGIRGEEKSDFLWIHSFVRRGEELEGSRRHFCDVNLISCTIHTYTLKVSGTKS